MSDLQRNLPDPSDEIEHCSETSAGSHLERAETHVSGSGGAKPPREASPFLGLPHGLSQAPHGWHALKAAREHRLTESRGLARERDFRTGADLELELAANLEAERKARADRERARIAAERFKVALETAPTLTPSARLRIARAILDRMGKDRETWTADDFSEDRQAKCWLVRRVAGESVSVIRRKTWRTADEPAMSAYNVTNLVRCGRWMCPMCGRANAREAAAALGVACQRHLGGVELARIVAASQIDTPEAWARVLDEASRTGEAQGRDVWMLTANPPNYADVPLELEIEQMFSGWSAFTRSSAFQRWCDRWGVVARVRALDATFGGKNGTNAHFHVALFPTNAYVSQAFIELAERRPELAAAVDAEPRKARSSIYPSPARIELEALDLELGKAAQSRVDVLPLRDQVQYVREAFLSTILRDLVPAWSKAIRAQGARIQNLTDFHNVSLQLQPAEHAISYFTKWGLADEVGAPTSKSNNHLRLLDLVADGLDVAGDYYLDFRRATNGRTWVTGLGDLRARYGVTDADVESYCEELRRKRRIRLEREGVPILDLEPFTVRIDPRFYPGAIAATYETLDGWDAVAAFLDDAHDARGLRGIALQDEFDRFLFHHLARPDDS